MKIIFICVLSLLANICYSQTVKVFYFDELETETKDTANAIYIRKITMLDPDSRIYEVLDQYKSSKVIKSKGFSSRSDGSIYFG